MLITCPKCSVKYKVPSEISLKKGQKVQCSACAHIFEFIPSLPDEKPVKNNLLPPEDAVLSIHTKTEKIAIQTSVHEEAPAPKTPAPLPEAFRPLQLNLSSARFRYGKILLCCVLMVCFVCIGWLWRDVLFVNGPFENLLRKESVSHSVHHAPVTTKKMKKTRPSLIPKPVLPAVLEPVTEEPEVVPQPVPAPSIIVQSVRFRQTAAGAVLIEGNLKNTSSATVPLPEKVYALAYGENGALLFEKEIYLPAGFLSPDMEQSFFGTYSSVDKGVQWVEVVLKK